MAGLRADLVREDFLAGHTMNLNKLEKDLQKQIENYRSNNSAKSLVPSPFRKSEEAPALVANFKPDWHQSVRFEIVDAAKEKADPYLDIN